MRPSVSRFTALLLVAGVGLSCSSDTIAGPGRPEAGSSYTLALTSVSGARIPAVFYSDVGNNARYWADSATATVQADGVIVFHLYESGTTPLGAPHMDQPSQAYSTGGVLTSDSTFAVYYSDAYTPDIGTISKSGSITVDLTGLDESGQQTSFGRWVFASPYRGPALNPAPRVTAIDPASLIVGNADVTLKVYGSSFTSATVVSYGDQTLQSTLVSPTQLQVTLPGNLLTAPTTLTIVVTNPGPGGGTYHFPVDVARAAPTLTALSPNTLAAGSETYTVAVTGTGFDAGTMVSVNGLLRYPSVKPTPTSLSFPLRPGELDVTGVVEIAIVNPPPGGGTSNTLLFNVTPSARKLTSEVIAPTSTRLLAGDPVRSVVYAGEDGGDAAHPSSIVAFDGTNGSVLWTIPLHGVPTMLTVSGDGQFLYYAASQDSSIHRVALTTRTEDLTIPIYHTAQCTPLISSVAVAPGNPHRLAVEQSCLPGSATAWYGVVIYDDSIAQPQIASDPDNPTLGPITFGASAGTIYSFTSGRAYTLTLGASGATIAYQHYASGPVTLDELTYANGAAYTTSGPVSADGSNAQPVRGAWFPSNVYSTVRSSDGKTLYGITDRLTLDALDVSQNTLVGNVPVPGPEGLRDQIVRWGTDGIAFVGEIIGNSGKLYMIRSDLVH